MKLTRRHFIATSAAAGAALLKAPIARAAASTAAKDPLRLGHALHAFDHLGAYGAQADACVDSGANILYASGIGGLGYEGLPAPDALKASLDTARTYNANAKKRGAELMIGYLCATSLCNLEKFDANWSTEFRAQFKTPPAEWRQQGRDGKVLESWYGGVYTPACMNHPDWRAYQRHLVRLQLACGHDGIFFDNPTVHTKGCYCAHCMNAFAAFLKAEKGDTETMRGIADKQPRDFLRFRTTIARDFLAAMREHARSIDSQALVTANNSLNSPGVFYSQCKGYGYSPYEMSKTEDFVVVEDMATQPRAMPDGKFIEYGPTLQCLRAISHGKPVVAIALAEADYHTPPNLTSLAMAECAAHGASYLAWPTWPEEQRKRMGAEMRKQADFMRRNADLMRDAVPRADVALFLPMRRWLDTDKCIAHEIAAELTRENVQYTVFCEEDFAVHAAHAPFLVIEDEAILTPDERAHIQQRKMTTQYATAGDWLAATRAAAQSIAIEGPASIRVRMLDSGGRTAIHLFNLDILRRSSFDDEVRPARDIRLRIRTAAKTPRGATLDSADEGTPRGPLVLKVNDGMAEVGIPLIEVGAILVLE